MVEVQAVSLEQLKACLGPDRAERFEQIAVQARERLGGRRVVNVNSTATGGGVAELLQTMLAYAAADAGVDARWVVIEGDPAFFEITKRLHNHLYGGAGDAGALGAAEHGHYEEMQRRNIDVVCAEVRPGDIVILHDPHTAGLLPHLKEVGARVVWRCHIGIDEQNEHSERAWGFVRRYVEGADGFVFSRAEFAPSWVPRDRLAVIPPSINPLSTKNTAMGDAQVVDMLRRVGLLAHNGPGSSVTFTRRDGSQGRVACQVNLLGTGPAPNASEPIVLQASRWDPMKDMQGVMRAFAEFIAPHSNAHLVLAGPEASGVSDDPESGAVLTDCLRLWDALPAACRSRIHLASVPMTDSDEAAAIVNTLQRHTTVVAQKSLAEGFGLTVAEAMWKERPVVGGAVGGVVDQIVDGVHGYLVDPVDLEQFAGAVRTLLDDPEQATRMGAAGHDRVCELFLGDRHLEQWAVLLEPLA